MYLATVQRKDAEEYCPFFALGETLRSHFTRLQSYASSKLLVFAQYAT